MSERIDHLVVLCGGKGSRLHSVIPDIPKALVDVNGQPFLEHLLHFAGQSGFATVTLACGHLSDAIETFVNNRQTDDASPSVKILIEKETTPMGTGGAVLRLLERLPSQFAVCNADTLFDFPIESALEWYTGLQNACGVIAHKGDREQLDAGHIVINSEDQIVDFIEKCELNTKRHTYINSGFYFFDKKLINDFEICACSLEIEILPELARQGVLHCYHKMVKPFHDYGTLERYKKLNDREVKEMEIVNDRN